MSSGDACCRAIAAGQHGVIARFQALDHLSASAIARRLTSGVWVQVLPQTYVVDGAPSSDMQRVMAVALWAMGSHRPKDSTCISHKTAAWLFRLQPQPQTIHVTSARALQARKGITPHRMVLDPVDVTSTGPVPVTTVARTLLDLGSVCDVATVESALESALRRHLVSIPRLEWQLGRCGGRGRRGAKTLRALLEDRARGYIPSESELELRLYRLLKKARLPLPSRQKVFKDRGHFIARVDYAYPELDLVIEVHGWRYHSEHSKWERDQARTRALVLSGQRVLVFNWNEITKEPSVVATEVARALGIEQLF